MPLAHGGQIVFHAWVIAKASIPNFLTGLRVLAVPATLIAIWLHSAPLVLFGIFLFASLTDFLDGYLARKWNCVSAFGALADPVADKLLVALMLLFLLRANELPLTPVVVIILREIYVSALRDFISARGGILPVNQGGKWKTALQMLSIIGLLGALVIDRDDVWNASVILLWAAAALALVSAITYTRAAMPLLKA